jgi:hypothetical protein
MNELLQISNFKDFKLKFEIRDLESLKFEILEINFRQKKSLRTKFADQSTFVNPKKIIP